MSQSPRKTQYQISQSQEDVLHGLDALHIVQPHRLRSHYIERPTADINMADAGVCMLAAANPNPTSFRSPNSYLQSPPSSDSFHGRRRLSIPQLSLYDPHNLPAMAAPSMVPNLKAEFGAVGTGIAYGAPITTTPVSAGPVPNDPNNPLNLNLLKSFTDKRVTRDGQPAKRRGPKPDSKPALTRRQELNRQAQRTHRERKELYIKALEDEVMRLKEIYSNVSHDKDRLAEENRSLKALLHQNGLAISPGTAMMTDDGSSHLGPYLGTNSSPSVTGSASYGMASASTQNTAYTPPPGSALSTTGAMPRGLSPGGLSPATQTPGLHRPSHSGHSAGPQRNPMIDYDQNGINFVLTLERPCMDHMPWLLERSSTGGGVEPCGHALMASCPPEPFPDLTPDIPFGQIHGARTVAHGAAGLPPAAADQGNPAAASTGVHNHGRNFSSNAPLAPTSGDLPANGLPSSPATVTPVSAQTFDYSNEPPRTWELSKADLATLLDLSQKLNLDGEITPVMAWGMVLAHPRLGQLNDKDFENLAEELTSKVRCFGFGAVMEEFEVRDALEAVFSTKPEPLGMYPGSF